MDGNERCAWAAAWTFLFINGTELDPEFDVNAAEEFVLTVAEQNELSIGWIAEGLARFTT